MKFNPIIVEDGEQQGIDPRKISIENFKEIGHESQPLLSVIREYCIECCGGVAVEAKRCTAVRCVMWPYRMGTNPLRPKREMSEEQRAASAERLRNSRMKKVATEDEEE